MPDKHALRAGKDTSARMAAKPLSGRTATAIKNQWNSARSRRKRPREGGGDKDEAPQHERGAAKWLERFEELKAFKERTKSVYMTPDSMERYNAAKDPCLPRLQPRELAALKEWSRRQIQSLLAGNIAGWKSARLQGIGLCFEREHHSEIATAQEAVAHAATAAASAAAAKISGQWLQNTLESAERVPERLRRRGPPSNP